MPKLKRNESRSLICMACTIIVLLLFGVAFSLILGGMAVAAVGYAVVGFALQHKHRPRPRIRH